MGKKDKRKSKKKHETKVSAKGLDLRAAELPQRPKPLKPADIRAAAQRQLERRGELGTGDPRAATGNAEVTAYREEESGSALGLVVGRLSVVRRATCWRRIAHGGASH